jgi:hypothetical protein
VDRHPRLGPTGHLRAERRTAAAPWAPPASAPGFPQAPDGAPGGPPA